MRLGEGKDACSLASILGCKCIGLSIKYLKLSLGVKYKNVLTRDLVVAHFE